MRGQDVPSRADFRGSFIGTAPVAVEVDDAACVPMNSGFKPTSVPVVLLETFKSGLLVCFDGLPVLLMSDAKSGL